MSDADKKSSPRPLVPVVREEGAFPAGDGTALFARSVRPADAGDCWARVCLAPGYGDHGGRYEHVLTHLAEQGVAASVLDFRGQGRAGGRRGYARRWDDYVDDWALFLAGEAGRWKAAAGLGPPPRFLLGHSHGALVTIVAALEGRLPPDVRGVVLTAPYLRLKMAPPPAKLRLARAADRVLPWLTVRTDVPEAWMTDDPQMLAADRADPLSLGVATPRWFLATLARQQEALSRAGEFSLPLRVIAGDRDELADSAAARDFCEAAGSADRSFGHYPELRHEPLRETRRDAILADILAWLRERSEPAA
ncbi:MAG TPA: alpha/beta fold hydrolase [Armatimonadaceae bacterium]|nr:alpha/beta fold hydrolase [Armatimonadaceae bacterium]